jgi:uncharacterized membrane protein YfcA
MMFVALLAIGILTGVLSSILGIGGGVVMIPLFGLVFPDMAPRFLIACSLSIILFNSMINVWRFSKKIKIDWNIIGLVAVCALISGFLASQIGSNMSEMTLRLVFGGFLLIGVLPLTLASLYNVSPFDHIQMGQKAGSVFIGLISGGISGLTGLGGGVIIVPLLNTLLKIDFKRVSAYSNALMVFTSASAALGYALEDATLDQFFTVGYVVPEIVVMVLIGAFVGGRLGVYVHGLLSKQNLKRAFIGLIVIVIVRTILQIV